MKRSTTVSAALVLLMVFPAARAWGDEIYLKNGNHLSGTIVSLSEDTLVLDTDFAGRLSIDRSRVERISADAPTGSAQVEPAEPVALSEEPPVKFAGRMNVGLNKASGNTDKESGHVDAELGATTARHRLTIAGAYNRASDNNRKSEDNVTGSSHYSFLLTEALYVYLKGMAERDTFKDINLRTTVGPGLGYEVFKSERMNLSIEAGPSYVRTDYDEAADEDSLSGRWAVKFDRFFFEKAVQYYFTNEGYISASDYRDTFMFTRTGLRFPVRGGLFFAAGFEWDWDNTPAEGTDKSDYRYILSIGFGF